LARQHYCATGQPDRWRRYKRPRRVRMYILFDPIRAIFPLFFFLYHSTLYRESNPFRPFFFYFSIGDNTPCNPSIRGTTPSPAVPQKCNFLLKIKKIETCTYGVFIPIRANKKSTFFFCQLFGGGDYPSPPPYLHSPCSPLYGTTPPCSPPENHFFSKKSFFP